MTEKQVHFEDVEVGAEIPALVKKPNNVRIFMYCAACWLFDQGGKAYEQMLYRFNVGYQPWKFAPYRPGTGTNCAMVDDPVVNEAYAAASAANSAGNYAEQARIIRETFPYIMEQAWCVQPPAPYKYSLWWPWVKNYHGTTSIGYFNRHMNVKYIWLDQELEKEMTGK